ncbi:DEAD/DEAH box helicase [Pseudoalteromonas sp. T1lg65]|uniref:DEAD/DEAH box helicase n=1 Tax=Pseudoalteromonas sp. T1lg65 TaxID=2077101 RepID=UPI003F79B994
MTLPIETIKDQFITELTSRSAIVVSATTGSGKSTCLPIWSTNFGKVLVIEPRRIACTALANYVSHLQHSPLGEKIGYAIRFEGQFSENTDVIYATPGVALRWFLENALADFQVVMLDEFHERRWDMDLLLALLKKQHKHKLIVTSATLHSQKLANYLDTTTLASEGSLFPVEEMFFAADSRKMPSKINLAENVFEACRQALAKSSGDILVFLPGKAEIQACQAKLQSLPTIVIGLYSGCTQQAQDAALTQQSQRRIILATNVAETSLTIPNVTCVIDSGLERRTHLRQGKTVLGLDAIARDSAKQRRGRAGRTQSGICIRLYGAHAPLLERTPPEIQRESLTELVLAAGCAEFGVSDLAFIDPLPESSLQRALGQLQKLKAIDEQGIATELGRQLYPLPVDIEFAFIISQIGSNTLRQAAIDLLSLLSVPAKVYQLPNDAEKVEQLNKRFPHGSDFEIAIAAVRDQTDGLISLEPEAIKEAKLFSEHLRAAFSLPELKYAASYNHEALVLAIAELTPENIFINKSNRRNGFNNGQVEVIPARETRISEKVDALLVLNTYALAGKGTKQAMTLATCNAPLCAKQLQKLAIGELQFSSAIIEGDKLSIQYQRCYAGEVIAQQVMEPASTADLYLAVSHLITEQLLFPTLITELRETIEYTKLYYEYHDVEENTPTLEQHLHNQLAALGVETFQDLELLEPEDFAFTRIDDWKLEPFKESHPLILTLPRLQAKVNYHFKGKRIELEYLSGERKDAPKRWELPAWSGFKVRYRKASRVVDVK